jgi:uncharacterized membrane protein
VCEAAEFDPSTLWCCVVLDGLCCVGCVVLGVLVLVLCVVLVSWVGSGVRCHCIGSGVCSVLGVVSLL